MLWIYMSDRNQILSIYYQDSLLSMSLCTSTPIENTYQQMSHIYVYLLIILIQVTYSSTFKTSYFIHFIFIYKWNYIKLWVVL